MNQSSIYSNSYKLVRKRKQLKMDKSQKSKCKKAKNTLNLTISEESK